MSETIGKKVFLVTAGSGDDGDAWDLVGVFSTREGAEIRKKKYDARSRVPSSPVEEAEVDPQ